MNSTIEPDDYSDFTEERVLTVPRELAGERLDAALASLMPEYSRSRISNWIKDGLVTVDGKESVPKLKLWGGEHLCVHIQANPEETSFQAEDIPLDVVYEDESILVIDKPAGLVVHPGSGNWSGTVLNGLLFAFPELKTVPRAGIVHRLDKDTSGLMVVARTLTAQNNLVQQLQARTVKRHYLAIVQGKLAGDGTVDAPIGRHPRERIKMAVVHTGKPAITHWRAIEQFAAHTLVECRLETGRTHQIRVHMAHIGHPLAADPVYGGKPRLASQEMTLALEDFNRQALHARKLSLVHPENGKTMTWKAPVPEDMTALLYALRADAGMAEEEEDWDDDDWGDEDDNCEIFYVKE
ncbi:23S rRNA pseudouridine1911/1915/1917 synthase [Formivibrio citricus]|uniref:Pseudouridine synthase n=2 Tax=Formivibrio citricus TaxID=83765 RepID=A0A1I5AT50_9NEIS|nr:23S rRNA pseudouridine1911/1915/1917 synthase [Formivibrio citricus]